MFRINENIDKELIKRFNEKIIFGNENDCWLWNGALQGKGYGSFGTGDGNTELAHRFAYQIDIGNIPEGKIICHKCDCRRCVNPKHLFIGTHQDNSDDKIRKGREARWEYNGRSRLKMEDVHLMRKYFRSGKKTIKTLAQEYEVHYNTARNAIHRITWKD